MDYISKLLFCSISLFVISCDSQRGGYADKDFVIVKKVDKFVDFVSGKEGRIYIRTSISEQCGLGKYFYNDFVVLDDTITKDMIKVSLNSMIDLDSLQLVKAHELDYEFEDKKYIYSLHLMMCDSNVIVELSQ